MTKLNAVTECLTLTLTDCTAVVLSTSDDLQYTKLIFDKRIDSTRTSGPFKQHN